MAQTLVLFDYRASKDDEISVIKGEIVDVREAYDDGWWLVENNRREKGLVPANYVILTALAPDSLLPPGWKSALDAESNQKYYYNSAGVIFPSSEMRFSMHFKEYTMNC
jgi:hypothetical protein